MICWEPGPVSLGELHIIRLWVLRCANAADEPQGQTSRRLRTPSPWKLSSGILLLVDQGPKWIRG